MDKGLGNSQLSIFRQYQICMLISDLRMMSFLSILENKNCNRIVAIGIPLRPMLGLSNFGLGLYLDG